MADVPPDKPKEDDPNKETTKEEVQTEEDDPKTPPDFDQDSHLVHSLNSLLDCDVDSSLLNRSIEEYESSNRGETASPQLQAAIKVFEVPPQVIDPSPVESSLPDEIGLPKVLFEYELKPASGSLVTDDLNIPSNDPTLNSSASDQNLSLVPVNLSENVGLGGSLVPYQNPNLALVPYASDQNNFNPYSTIPQPSYALHPNFAAGFGPPPFPQMPQNTYYYNMPENYQNMYQQHPMGMPYQNIITRPASVLDPNSPPWIPQNTHGYNVPRNPNPYYIPDGYQNTYEQNPMGMQYQNFGPMPPWIPRNTYGYNVPWNTYPMMRMGMQPVQPQIGQLMLTQRPHWTNSDGSSNSSQD